jgi:hypothetical protein
MPGNYADRQTDIVDLIYKIRLETFQYTHFDRAISANDKFEKPRSRTQLTSVFLLPTWYKPHELLFC